MRLVEVEESWKSLYTIYEQQRSSPQMLVDPATNESMGPFAGSVFEQIALLAGKGVELLTIDDFRINAPLTFGVDPFELSISRLFLIYYRREDRNSYLRFKASEGDANVKPLSQEEFTRRYGPPPWVLLNGLLNTIGMPYRFLEPADLDELTTEYEPVLQDQSTGFEIRIDDLSSGEKTLMAIAISLYSGLYLRTSMAFPQILLFDESDSTLHPSMVKALLDVIQKTFVDDYGAKVILTTHSPTTIALAPDESLYVMRRSAEPRIVKATRDEALAHLLVGVPTLSVSNENRRQVFVEAPDDQECYQLLWTILRPTMGTELSLEFIASGSGGKGNRYEAEQLVTGLRGRGNKVLGVVDRDAAGKHGVPDGIVVDPDRYAIENLLLDPVSVGLLLLRERGIPTEEVPDPDVAFHQIEQEQAQRLCDYVVEKARRQLTDPQMKFLDESSTSRVEYAGGGTVEIPTWVLNYNGHDWEEKLLLPAFPSLNGFRQNRKLSVIERVYKDVPQWIPLTVRKLFEDLLAYD